MVTRVCSKCGEEKTSISFYRHHPYMCKKCFNAYQRGYYRRVRGMAEDVELKKPAVVRRKVEPDGECCGTCKSYSKSSGGLTTTGGWCMARRRSTHSSDTCERWRAKKQGGRYEQTVKPIPTYTPSWE